MRKQTAIGLLLGLAVVFGIGATLEGQKIKDRFGDLLQVSNTNSGVDGTTRVVEDGEGTQSALFLSTTVVDVNGNELILDVDADSSITSDTDDQIDIKVGGVDSLTITATGMSGSSWIGFGANIQGLRTLNAADGEHDITILVGNARDATFARSLKLSTNLTKQIDSTWAVGTNAGGLDSGDSLTADTVYALWLIYDSASGTTDAMFATSFTAPTMPGSYDFKRLIAAVTTNTDSNIIGYIQTGDYFRYMSEIPRDISDSTMTTWIWEIAQISTPPTALAQIYLHVEDDSAGSSVAGYVMTPNGPERRGVNLDATVEFCGVGATGSTHCSTTGWVKVDGSSQVHYSMGITGNETLEISTIGFIMLMRSDP